MPYQQVLKACMVNTKPLKHDAAFTMRTDKQFLADLDDLRVAERPVLSRAEYLRKLVTEAKKGSGRRK